MNKENYYKKWKEAKEIGLKVEYANDFLSCKTWRGEANPDMVVDIQDFISDNIGLVTRMLIKKGDFK